MIKRFSADLGDRLNLSGAEIIESMVLALANQCVDMAEPEHLDECILETAKLLQSYVTAPKANMPMSSTSIN